MVIKQRLQWIDYNGFTKLSSVVLNHDNTGPFDTSINVAHHNRRKLCGPDWWVWDPGTRPHTIPTSGQLPFEELAGLTIPQMVHRWCIYIQSVELFNAFIDLVVRMYSTFCNVFFSWLDHCLYNVLMFPGNYQYNVIPQCFVWYCGGVDWVETPHTAHTNNVNASDCPPAPFFTTFFSPAGRCACHKKASWVWIVAFM